MKLPQPLRFVLPLLVLTVLSSCSGDFRKTWKEAPEPTFGFSADGCVLDCVGKWEGTWHSEATGHHGKLRCVVSYPVNQSDDREFFYHATWMGFLSGSYKATHSVQKKGDTYVFKGEHKMPDWAGGLYYYDGTIKANEFKADYKSSADHGAYTMKRVR